MKQYLSKISSKYNELPLNYKRGIIFGLLIVAIVAIGFFRGTSHQKVVQESRKSKIDEVPLDRGVLEKSYYLKTLSEKEGEKEEIDQLRKAVEDLTKKMQAEEPRSRKTVTKTAELPEAQTTGERKTPPEGVRKTVRPLPPPPEDLIAQLPNNQQGSNNKGVVNKMLGRQQQQQESGPIGGIAVASNDVSDKDKKKEKGDVKKNVIHLPPSFMSATLLSGLDAPTSEQGKSNPVPVIFRINAPAVLPNRVKANLKDCFVIGEGYGRLDTERIDIRPVNLSCVDVKGNGLIVSPLQGYVVDADSKVGLSGRVVSKMGAVLAKHLLASVMGGLSEAAKISGTEYSTSEFGIPVQTVGGNTEDAFKAGFGEGLSKAFDQLQKFYLDLAKQTLPVIEVGALKKVFIVITKEASIEIKDL